MTDAPPSPGVVEAARTWRDDALFFMSGAEMSGAYLKIGFATIEQASQAHMALASTVQPPAEPHETTKAEAELDKLVRFFNSTDGYSFGREGDIARWTPAETAIEIMQRRVQPPAVDEMAAEVGRLRAALNDIAEMCPATQEISTATLMGSIAIQALSSEGPGE